MAADLAQLTLESSEWCLGSDVKLLAWLKCFSHQITERSQAVNSRIDALTQDTLLAQSELHNAFTSLQQLSNTQFIEQRIQDEDETLAPVAPPVPRASGPPTAPGPESFEQNVGPKYREAVHSAWAALESQEHPPEPDASRRNKPGEGGAASAGREWVDRPLPLILGTDAFLVHEFCGLPPPESGRYPDLMSASRGPQQSGNHSASSDEEPEKDGGGSENGELERVADSQSEGEVVEEGWTQISSRREDSELEPAVSAALNFRAMLEEALRGPSGTYEDASSPPPRPSDHRDESDPATWPAPSGHPADDLNGPIRAIHDGESEGHGQDCAADEDVTRMGTPSESLREGTKSGNSKPSDSSIDGGRNLAQRIGKRVSFPDEEGSSYEEGGVFGREGSSVTRGGVKHGEQGVGKKAAARTLYGASGEESDDDDFSFGGLARLGSGKGKPSYALDFDELFKRKAQPRSVAGQGNSHHNSNTPDPEPFKKGLGVSNAAMDAITAALKQRQAAFKPVSEEPSRNLTDREVVKSDPEIRPAFEEPTANPVRVSVREEVGSNPEGRLGGDSEEHEERSPVAPLQSELSFGLIDDPAAGLSKTRENQNQAHSASQKGGESHSRTDHDRWRLVGLGSSNVGQEGDGFVEEGKPRPEAASGAGAQRPVPILFGELGEQAKQEIADTARRRDGEVSSGLGSGDNDGKENGRILEKETGGSGDGEGSERTDRNERLVRRSAEASTSGGETSVFRFGKGFRRASLFGDSDEDEDFGLPLFGGKVGAQPTSGGRRRGLFEDSDEEEGLGSGRQASSRGAGLFNFESGLGDGSFGVQKRSSGIFAKGGLFTSDLVDELGGPRSTWDSTLGEETGPGEEVGSKGMASTSGQRSRGGEGAAAESTPKTVKAEAAGKVDGASGLLQPSYARKGDSSLGADLFGDNDEDKDLFGPSISGRRSGLQDKSHIGEGKTSGVSALLESNFESDEEDPWEDRLARLKDGE